MPWHQYFAFRYKRIGLDTDLRSRLRNTDGKVSPGLLAFGPITRGSFGEMTGAPDFARHL
jgi:uncharacterized NAD(P)/FAD-binding protein YdhS